MCVKPQVITLLIPSTYCLIHCPLPFHGHFILRKLRPRCNERAFNYSHVSLIYNEFKTCRPWQYLEFKPRKIEEFYRLNMLSSEGRVSVNIISEQQTTMMFVFLMRHHTMRRRSTCY